MPPAVPAGAGRIGRRAQELGQDMTMLDRLPRLQGLIGAGTMGSLMAGCLLDAGVTLKVYDRRRRLRKRWWNGGPSGRRRRRKRPRAVP